MSLTSDRATTDRSSANGEARRSQAGRSDVETAEDRPTSDPASTPAADTVEDTNTSGDTASDLVEPRWRELRWALAGGGVAAGGVVLIAFLIGGVSAFEARRLFEGIKPTATFAASTYIGAGATILALMATMVGFSITHESHFRQSHYRRLRIVAGATTGLIGVAIAMLSCLIVPVAEADTTANGYVALYWAIVGLGAVGAGLVIVIVLMLNYTVRGLIELGRHGRSPLVRADDD